jgi:hypothetical protein
VNRAFSAGRLFESIEFLGALPQAIGEARLQRYEIPSANGAVSIKAWGNAPG